MTLLGMPQKHCRTLSLVPFAAEPRFCWVFWDPLVSSQRFRWFRVFRWSRCPWNRSRSPALSWKLCFTVVIGVVIGKIFNTQCSPLSLLLLLDHILTSILIPISDVHSYHCVYYCYDCHQYCYLHLPVCLFLLILLLLSLTYSGFHI